MPTLNGANAATVRPGEDAPPAKRRYTRLDEIGEQKLQAMLEGMLTEGPWSKADYAYVATQFSVSTRTVESRAQRLREADPRPTDHGSGWLPDDVLERIAGHRQLRSAWESYVSEGALGFSYDTFLRRVYAEHGANTVRGLTRGVKSMRTSTFVVGDLPPFMQRFSVDLFGVRAPALDGDIEVRPTGMLVREMCTSVVVFSWVFPTDQVTAADVMAVLAEAFRGRTFAFGDGAVFLGGVPDMIRSDNGGQFTAAELDELLVPLGVRPVTSNSYRSHELGAHERVHGTLRAQLLDLLPGSEDGPRDHRGQLVPDGRPVVDLTDLRELIDRWAWRFNTTDNGERSPLQRWVEAVSVSGNELPAPVDTAFLATFAAEVPRTVRRDKRGLRWNNNFYTFPELERLPQRRFRLRTWKRDDRTVEVFATDGTYVGLAARNGALTAAETSALQVSAGDAERTVKEVLRRRNRVAEHLDDAEVPVDADADATPAAGPPGGVRVGGAHVQADALLDALRAGGQS